MIEDGEYVERKKEGRRGEGGEKKGRKERAKGCVEMRENVMI